MWLQQKKHTGLRQISGIMAELKAAWGVELVSMGSLTSMIALVQLLYNFWRIFVDGNLLLDITFTRLEPGLGYYVFNWDVSNIFTIARFATNIFGIIAACALATGSYQHLAKRRQEGWKECLAVWRSLTVCQPCVILLEVTLAVLRWDAQMLINLVSRWAEEVFHSCKQDEKLDPA